MNFSKFITLTSSALAGGLLLANSALADQNADRLQGLWTGQQICNDGTFGIVADMRVKDGARVMRRKHMFHGGKAGQRSVEITDVVYAQISEGESLGFTPVHLMRPVGKLRDWGPLSLKQDPNKDIIKGVDGDCDFTMTKSKAKIATPADYPTNMPAVTSTGLNDGRILVLWADEWGAHFAMHKNGVFSCSFHLVPLGNGKFDRIKSFETENCSSGKLDILSPSKIFFAGPDGTGAKIPLKTAKKYSRSVGAFEGLALPQTQSAQTASSAGSGGTTSTLTSSFAGMGLSVGDVPLGLNFLASMRAADPSIRLQTKTWAAKSTTVFEKPVAPRTEYKEVNFGITNIHKVNDRTIVKPTHWHTGQMVSRVTKSVSSSKPELMPTADALIAATKAKFGDGPITDQKTYGAGGMGQQTFKMLAYPIKNGKRHAGRCFHIDSTFGRATRSTQERLSRAQAMIDQIEKENYCSAVVMVMYTNGRMGRLREYRIVARDFLMEAKDFISEIETRAQLLKEHEAQMPTVAPEL